MALIVGLIMSNLGSILTLMPVIFLLLCQGCGIWRFVSYCALVQINETRKQYQITNRKGICAMLEIFDKNTLLPVLDLSMSISASNISYKQTRISHISYQRQMELFGSRQAIIITQ